MKNKTKTTKITNITKTTKQEKLKCPVCQTKITLTVDTKSKIIVCSVCDNSLFLHKTKKNTIVQPFALNLGIEGNRLVPEDEFDESDEFGLDPEDFEDDELD